jgi:hypothetical protein
MSYDQISQNPRWGAMLAERDEGERRVLTLTDELQDALTNAEPGRFADVAARWAQTEECRMDRLTTADLVQVLERLGALAKGATERGDHLYCWMCV